VNRSTRSSGPGVCVTAKAPPQVVVVSVALGVALVALLTDIFTSAEYCPPILYVIGLAVCVWVRDRRIIWVLALAALVLTFLGGLYPYPPENPYSPTAEFWINRVFVAITLGALGLILTSYNALAAAYRTRGEELADANRKLEMARKRAEEASARKTRFMAAISHDIRTPATAIRMLARVIRQVRTDPPRIDDLTLRLESSATALTELLTDALDVAKFESEALTVLDETDFLLSAVIHEAVTMTEPLADAKGLRLGVRDEAAGVHVHADRSRLVRVVVNLLDNAVKFTDAGTVSVHSSIAADGGIRITVRDTGCGIAPEHLARIFDEFFQVRRAARDRDMGRGLGLATCKRLVEAMQGHIDVDSRLGNGTVFTIVFPASRVSARRASPPHRSGVMRLLAKP
jgi:signal transduction histidine kinase